MTTTRSEVTTNDLIRAAMALRGIDQCGLAEALGTVQSSISLRLSGGQDWRLNELRTVAAFLQVDITALVAASPDITAIATRNAPAPAVAP